MAIAGLDEAQVKRIFSEALDGAPHQRARFLRSACAGDESLRARVQALLDAHDKAADDNFLAAPTVDAVAGDGDGPDPRRPGDVAAGPPDLGVPDLEGPARGSGRTSSCRAWGRAGSAACSWPSSRSRSAAASR